MVAAAARLMHSVLINAVSIKEGGSAVVLQRLLDHMYQLEPEIEWHVAVDPRLVPGLPRHRSIKPIKMPHIVDGGLSVAHWYEMALPRIIADLKPDVVFSQTNYLPHRRISAPSLLLVQHAGHFSAEFERLTLAGASPLRSAAWRMKRRWVHRSVRRATAVTVQTAALADAIRNATGLSASRLVVIPHGPGAIVDPLDPRGLPLTRGWRIGYITKAGVQKNFATLLRAIARLRRAGHEAKLILTLGPGCGIGTIGEVESLSAELGLGDAVENLGERPSSDIARAYAALDVFVFPSVCESFGFPMVEAMASGLPLLVADTAGNREVAGPGTHVFAANDDATLAAQLAHLMTDRAHYERQALRSRTRALDFSWRESARLTLAALAATCSRGSA